jgi:hypothetical protein
MWNRAVGRGTSVAVLVSVTHGDGTPITGLQEGDFGLYVIDDSNNFNPRHVTPPEDFAELASPPDGLYLMGTGQPPGGTTGQWQSDEIVIVVEVQAGADRGRAFLNVVLI